MNLTGWQTKSGRCLLWFAATAIFLAGFGPWAGQSFKVQRVHRVGTTALPVAPNTGHAWTVDLQSLAISYMANASDALSRSTLQLLEDGKPLRPHAMHDDIRNKEFGCFSHWGSSIYFSSTDGSDPRANGRVYEIRYHEMAFPGLGVVMRSCLPVAVLSLLLLAILALTPAGIVDRSQRTVLAVALVGCFGFQLWEGRHNYGISPDSVTYIEAPGRSIRMPIYYGLMAAVTDPAKAEARAREMHIAGRTNTLLQGEMSEPLVRIVFAQKVVLLTALVVLFLFISLVLPAPLVAAVVLVVGFSSEKPILSGTFSWTFAGMWIAMVLAVGGWQMRRLGNVRSLITAGLLAFVVPVGWNIAMRFSLLPGYLHFVMSEPTAMAAQVMFVGTLVLYLLRGGARWLAVSMVFAAIAYLIRPAAIFCPVVVVLAAAISLPWTRWQWKKPALVLALGACLCVTPGIYKRLVDAPGRNISMRHWAMAAFALSIADSRDAVFMPDWSTRFIFESAMLERDKLREKVPDNPGAFYVPDIDRLSYYTYNILLPVSQAAARERYPNDEVAQITEWNRLLGEMAQPIFRAHWDRLLRVYASSYKFMVWQGTRFSLLRPFWVTLLAVAVLAALSWNRTTAAGVLLCVAHLLHLLVVSIFDQPLDRYVYATEYMIFIGMVLIAWGALLALRDGVAAKTEREAAQPAP